MNWIDATLFEGFKPLPPETFSERAEKWIEFNEPKRTGRFSLHQREYIREPLDCYGQRDITDIVLCWGTRTAKTTVMYAGAALSALEVARRILYVVPATAGPAGARSQARTRFIPMCRASKPLSPLIPTGALRHNFNTTQQMFLNGSIIDWTGSNSVGNLAANSCECVLQDEIDKFNVTRRRDAEGTALEANAVDLADERTSEYKYPKRVKSSTPTLSSGRIWSELLKTDLRRRFVPCPLCGRDHPKSKLVCLCWGETWTCLPLKFGFGTSYEPGTAIPLAWVRWDSEAKRPDGTWDLERVEKSAGYLCPHCHKRFGDEHKAWFDKNGLWLATQRGQLRSRGFHLPSMYSSHDQTSAGRLALDFLEACVSLEGPQNFINSKLAEPYGGQSSSAERVEKVAELQVGDEFRKILAVDCQQKAPYFWFVIRAYGGREIIGLLGGPCESWDEIRSAQVNHKVPDVAVIVDSGFGAKDDAEVYRTCAGHGELVRDPILQKLVHFGWMPAKGMPGRRRWIDRETGLQVPYHYHAIDPYLGTTDAGRVKMDLFEFASDPFNDMLDRLRHGKVSEFNWSISKQLDTDEYHLHMRGHVKAEIIRYGRPVYEWRKRYRTAPDHLRSCEIMQVAAATAFQFLTSNDDEDNSQEPQLSTDNNQTEAIAASA